MRSPEGQEFPGDGCYLEVVENRKLVWTACLLPGYRPKPTKPDDLPFAATILLEPQGAGTKYTAIAVHGSEVEAQKHAGWASMRAGVRPSTNSWPMSKRPRRTACFTGPNPL